MTYNPLGGCDSCQTAYENTGLRPLIFAPGNSTKLVLTGKFTYTILGTVLVLKVLSVLTILVRNQTPTGRDRRRRASRRVNVLKSASPTWLIINDPTGDRQKFLGEVSNEQFAPAIRRTGASACLFCLFCP